MDFFVVVVSALETTLPQISKSTMSLRVSEISSGATAAPFPDER